MDLAKWALRTSPKFTTGVISSIKVFDQFRDPEIPITLRPHFTVKEVKFDRAKCLERQTVSSSGQTIG